jgi:ATP-dependent DNA ligase
VTLWLHSTILDGEIVALDRDGMPISGSTEMAKAANCTARLHVFDPLGHDGSNWMARPLTGRREQLNKVVVSEGCIQIGAYVEGARNRAERLDVILGNPQELRRGRASTERELIINESA